MRRALFIAPLLVSGRVHQAWWVTEDGIERLDDRTAIARAVVQALLQE